MQPSLFCLLRDVIIRRKTVKITVAEKLTQNGACDKILKLNFMFCKVGSYEYF